MLKVKNGFVNGNSIKLKIEIKSDVKMSIETMQSNVQCSICSDVLDSQDISITPCGHLFCTACIIKAIRKSRVCPSCEAASQLKDLRVV